MKTSKNYIVIFALLIVAGLFTKACGDEFITRPSQGSLSEDVLADANGVNTLLIGAYASLSQTGPGGWGDGMHGGGRWEALIPRRLIHLLMVSGELFMKE